MFVLIPQQSQGIIRSTVGWPGDITRAVNPPMMRIAGTLVGALALVHLIQPSIALAALPPDAVALLETFPEKKITMDLVVGRAIEVSDSFRLLKSALPGTEVPFLQSRAALDTRLFGNATRLINENEPETAFNPLRTTGTNVAIGARKTFSTGTTATVELSHGNVNQTYPTDLSAPSGFSPFASLDGNRYTTKASVGLSQNLWKDAFGRATRMGLRAGELQKEAALSAFEESVQEWVFGIVQLYYGAWLAQSQVEAAHVNLQRRQRLSGITQIKANRGTAESPDVLQVRSALANSQVQLASAEQTLADRWRTLVMSLKLPEAWLTLEAREIPVALDDPLASALAACGTLSAMAPAPGTATSVKRAEAQAEAARLLFESAKDAARPDLDLNLSYATNGVDVASRGATLKDTASLDFPAWTVGLSFSFPLGGDAERATAYSAAVDRERAAALAAQAKNDLRLDWINRCSDLHRLQRAHQLIEGAFASQRSRAQAEEERFRLGRGSTLAVIQAGDDVTATEMALRGSEVERRVGAWRVLRIADGYKTYLERLKSMAQPRVGS